MSSATAFAPASVGNVAAGFDLLGHTIAGVGDTVTVRTIAEPVVRITAIRGVVEGLPQEAALNTAGRALMVLRGSLGLSHGFELEIDKGIALGSGLGGSAASCVAALVAANALLPRPLARAELYPFALQGEAVASGGLHGDNVGPGLVGGLALATHERIVRLPVPEGLMAVVVHPHFVLETRRSRAVLVGHYALEEFVAQSSHLALLLAGCYGGDLELVRAGLRDTLVEPRRAALIPGFEQVKQAALDAGALGSSISGGGPSVFAWCRDASVAALAGIAMHAAFAQAGLASDVTVSPVAGPAAEVVACDT